MSPIASPAGDMTAKEFARLRKKMGMDQHQLAHAIGLSVGCVSRYESGGREIPRKIELAMRYLVSTKRRS